MKITTTQAKKILTENYSFKQFAFSMMITRMKTLYAKNPTDSVLVKSTDEINKFLEQFSGVMGNDYAILTKL